MFTRVEKTGFGIWDRTGFIMLNLRNSATSAALELPTHTLLFPGLTGNLL